MDFLKENKIAIGGVVAALLAVGAYFAFFNGGAPSGALLSTADSSSPVSQDLLTTLQSVSTIKLDGTIFTSPVFTSLTDFGVQIQPEAVGRQNPFAPLVAPASAPAPLSAKPLALPGK
jgi:hypothetical protein